MATGVGIELSSTACRIVEVETARTWRRTPSERVVRAFAVVPPIGAATTAALASVRRRQASVVVWGVARDHRQVIVADGSYEAMRGEAVQALTAAGIDTRGAWADIAPVTGPHGGNGRASRRSVVAILADGWAMSSALRPLLDAGIRIRSATTPAGALSSLARMRRTLALAAPGATEVYVALEEKATCLAVTADGELKAARELAWGYQVDGGGAARTRGREDIAGRLAEALADLFAELPDANPVSQVCVCGGLPDLRSMTAPLMERLDVEVETLDSLFGIDAARLPAPADEFRERSAELRVAWAMASDRRAPINLLRPRRRQASTAMLARAAVVAGVAAGLGSGWRIERSHWWRSIAAPVAPRVMSKAMRPVVPVRALARYEPPQFRHEPRTPASLPVAEADPPSRVALVVGNVSRPEVPRPAATARPARRVVEETSFDGALGTILYSADRTLAIVGGRIVAPGDEIPSGTVVEISPAGVLVRDSFGRLRRMTLSDSGRR